MFYEGTASDYEYVGDEIEKSSLDEAGGEQRSSGDDYRPRSYDSGEFSSKPIKSEKCTIDENVIRLQYPFYVELSARVSVEMYSYGGEGFRGFFFFWTTFVTIRAIV